MKKKRINKKDEDLQRFGIIRVSCAADASHLKELLCLLRDKRTTYANRRHVVRALGRIGGAEAKEAILSVLTSGSGLILGDAAEAAGKLSIRDALPTLHGLTEHRLDWVRQKSAWAIGRMESNKRKLSPSALRRFRSLRQRG